MFCGVGENRTYAWKAAYINGFESPKLGAHRIGRFLTIPLNIAK